MSRRAPLRIDVARVIDRYLGLMAREGALRPRGLYLVGSVALGDYRPGASDIDFVALLDAPPTAEETDALARVHAALASHGAPAFDGFYIRAEALRRPPERGAVVPFSLEGRLRSGEICREVSPVTWRCLARSGRPILGPAPAALGIADDDVALRADGLANLDGYWRRWIAECEAALARKAEGEACAADALAWGVLGIARVTCTLATGQIVSKSGGGRFALDLLPEARHPVVREALAAHRGETERVPQATIRAGLDTMRFLIDIAHGSAPGAQAPTSPDR